MCQSVAFSDNSWVIVFQNNYGETIEIPMSEVGSLVSVDDAYDFSILSVNGTVLAEGVLKVSFKQKGATAINHVPSENNIIGRVATDKLTLIGVAGEVCVYSAAGILQTKVYAVGNETVINIGHFSSGVYLVKVGKQVFKFVKK